MAVGANHVNKILVTTPIPSPGMHLLAETAEVVVKEVDYDGLVDASACGASTSLQEGATIHRLAISPSDTPSGPPSMGYVQ